MKIKKGGLFILTRGEYSDYECLTLCKALTDLDIGTLKGEYLTQYPDESKDYEFSVSHFVAWLTGKKGPRLVKELKYQEWFLGDYGTAEFSLDGEER